MAYLLMKSARLWPAWASSTFAPTDVAARRSWRAKVRAVPLRRSLTLHNRTIARANRNVRSTISLGRRHQGSIIFYGAGPFWADVFAPRDERALRLPPLCALPPTK